MNATLLLFLAWIILILNGIALVVFSIVTMRKKILVEDYHIRIKRNGPGTTYGKFLVGEQSLHNDIRVAALVASMFFAAGAVASAICIVYITHHQ